MSDLAGLDLRPDPTTGRMIPYINIRGNQPKELSDEDVFGPADGKGDKTAAPTEMSDADVFGPAANTSMGQYAGLAGRAAVQAAPSAVFGIPALGMDAYDSLVNLTRKGVNAVVPEEDKIAEFPAFRHSRAVSDIGDQAATFMGLPEPSTKMQRGATDIGTAVLAALGGAGTAKGLQTLARGGDMGQIIDDISNAGARMFRRGMTPPPAVAPPVSLPPPSLVAPAASGAIPQWASDFGAAARAALGRSGTAVGPALGDLSSSPGMQAAGAAGGAAATSAAREAKLSPGATAALALFGSIAPGSVGSVGRRGVGAAKALAFNPFTPEGRAIMAGKILNKLATNPDLAAQRLGAAQEIVPGSLPTVAEASRDPGLIAAQSGVQASLDSGAATSGRLLARRSEQNTARQAHLSRIIPSDEVQQAMLDKRDAALTDNLAPAMRANQAQRAQGAALAETLGPNVAAQFNANLDPVFERMNAIRTSPAGKRQAVQDALDFANERLSQQGVASGDAETLYAVRKDLALARDGKYNNPQKSDLRLARGELGSVIKELDDAIEKVAPGYRRYLDLYSKRSTPLNQVAAIRQVRTSGQVTASDQMTGQRVLSNGSFQKALQTAIARGALKGRPGAPGNGPRIPFGPNGARITDSQMRIMQQVADDLDRGAAATAQTIKTPGSDTFRNFSVANVIGSVIGDHFPAGTAGKVMQSLATPLAWLYKLPDEAIGQLLVEAMLDPRLASRLMRQASRHEIENIAKELASRAAKQMQGGIYTPAK